MNPERVGRDGFLRLRFARNGRGRTTLAQSRFSLPLQVLTPLSVEDGSCYLMLLNPTGGVLGGDHLVTEVALEPGAHACLSTPSATRVYRTTGAPAVLETSIHMGEGAVLEYTPDHVIPHAASALHQTLRVELAQGAAAIVIDSVACGRKAHDERWEFREMDSRVDVRISGTPAYIHRMKIQPAIHPPQRFGWMEEFDYLSTVCVFADGFNGWAELCAAMNAALDEVPGVHGGASLLARGGCVARFLARSAPDMTLMNQRLWDAARAHVLKLSPFDHRKY